MDKYKELVEALSHVDTEGMCPCEYEALCKDKDCIVMQAADAIEELIAYAETEREFEKYKIEEAKHSGFIPTVEHKCHNCGATLELQENEHIFKCHYCGRRMLLGQR